MSLLLLMNLAFPSASGLVDLAHTSPRVLASGVTVLLATGLLLARPRDTLRHLARAIVHGLYRIDRSAFGTIPEQGAALLVANHVSFVDAVLIAALSPRPVRFVMDAGIYANPLLKPVFKAMGAIPISPARANRRLLVRAQDRIADALAGDELVCIFPEGAITRDGRLAPFRAGVEHIVRRTPVPVVPIGLCGLWGSMFSRAGRRIRGGLTAGPRRPLRIVSAPPVPPEDVTARGLQRIVAALLETTSERAA